MSIGFTMVSAPKGFTHIKHKPKSTRTHFIHGFIPCPALDTSVSVTHSKVNSGSDSELMKKNKKFPLYSEQNWLVLCSFCPPASLSLINSLFRFTHQLQTSHLAEMLKVDSSPAVPVC